MFALLMLTVFIMFSILVFSSMQGSWCNTHSARVEIYFLRKVNIKLYKIVRRGTELWKEKITLIFVVVR